MSAFKTAPDHQETGWPKGIPYIIGNEGCERFSYYGMKAILFVYLTHLMAASGVAGGLAEKQATEIVHTFNAAVYALPLVGAVIADRLLGKYSTILWLSLVYCAGHACLAIFERDFRGFAAGLVLIALGSGGIKPCVSAHVGDQFGRGNFQRVERVYQAFYFIINVGSLLSTLLIPLVKDRFGFGVAFAIPGVLMGAATLLFWMGRNVYVHVPARPGGKLGALDALSGTLLFMTIALPMFGSSLSGTYAGQSIGAKIGISLLLLGAGMAVFSLRQRIRPDDGFLAVIAYCLRVAMGGRELDPIGPADPYPKAEAGFFTPALRRFGREAAEGPMAVLRIVSVFALVSVFWALFDQHASSWTAQAREMDRSFHLLGSRFELMPEQIAAANPVLVLVLVPLTGYVVYPGIEKLLHVRMTPLRRMTLGMGFAALSFSLVALAQARLDAGERVHIAAQLAAYLALTLAEVMVSVTGLEFAYTQAPRRMKSLIMGFWLLSVSFGNILVALLSRLENMPRLQFFWTFAGLMAAATVAFGVRAAFYQYRTYTQ